MRRLLAAVLVVIAAVALAPPAVARLSSGPIASPVVFTPRDGTTLSDEGRGDFDGTIEVRRNGAGLTVINQLSLDDYVAGIREVPSGWPMEALKAQAVAARTYALWELEKGFWSKYGFDVCATTDCQVYDGLVATSGKNGRRWAQAVHDTAGQVLLYKGKPALARYHSSDGGRTLANETVFGSDGARPYLRSIDDPFDKASPLHKWTAKFTNAEIQEILHEGIGLQGQITNIEAKLDVDKVTITTRNGHVDVSAVRFRRVVSDVAPKDFPDKFPEARSDGLLMPFALPSSRFDIAKTSDGYRVDGIGYGHGVGMSQWGAKGRADAGQSYKTILDAYYHDLSPTKWTGRNSIRVAVDRGVGTVVVTGDGAFGVATSGSSIAPGTVGEWSIAVSGVRSMAVTPPTGYALPLVLTGVRAPSTVLIDPPKAHTVEVGLVLPKAAVVTASLTLDGKGIGYARQVLAEGERTIRIEPDARKVVGGKTYKIELTADDGSKVVTAATNVVLVKRGGGWWLKLFAIAVLVIAAVIVRRRYVLKRRASRRRSQSGDTSHPHRTGTASGSR